MNNDADTVKIRSIVEEGMILRVGDGGSILFWHDRWCKEGVLKLLHPRLFAISLQKQALICQMGEWIGNSWEWRLEWRRSLYDWEIDEVNSLQHIIAQFGPKTDTRDGVSWKHSEVVSYPTKDIVTALTVNRAPSLPKSVVSLVWKSFISPRAKLVVWLANQGKLKTGELLVGKGIISPLDSICPFCSTEIESITHLLFVCRFSWSAWMDILKWWNISSPLQNQCTKFCMQWLGLNKGRKHRKIWTLILGCVLWSVWYERNQIKFDRITPNLQNFVFSLKIRIGIWARELLGSSGWTPHVIHNADSFVLQAF
ncbi:uncharacterized protein LOC130801015 [Amaranthus tricolor]|uniref:uncharacterized protein LOC130801015 n=1 Tax=Amaranthus tricolor TaxID=29722 RepID=UPI0025907432|nr:uncharacterized protein LOC130801015 [Amaranthus tricolor]